MKIVSFNINGIRAHFHQLDEIFSSMRPDIIGLQETKIQDSLFPIEMIRKHGYYSYFYGQKMYYGVSILSKKIPKKVRYGFIDDSLIKKEKKEDKRIISADFSTNSGILTIINGYFPQGGNRKDPIKFLKKKIFYQQLTNYIRQKYNKDSLLIVMGDMNICPTNLDIGIEIKKQKQWILSGKCAFLPEEQIWIKNLLSCGLIDSYRKKYPNKKDQYSWFDYRYQNFERNTGLRIDFILISNFLEGWLIDSGIYYPIRSMNRPSDHVPVWTEISI